MVSVKGIMKPNPSIQNHSMKYSINLTDQQLITLFVNGDTNALEELIKKHKDRIFTSIVILVKDANFLSWVSFIYILTHQLRFHDV